MRQVAVTVLLLVVVAGAGCGADRAPRPDEGDGEFAGAGREAVAADRSILPLPFTAEQIRDEWVPGLAIRFLRRTPEGETRERWTVLAADEQGVEIEFAVLDDAGNPAGQPMTRRSSWEELRDHAAFPADRASRAEATRRTPLGLLDGWIYTFADDSTGTVTEFFFARELPGAPVYLRTRRDEALVLELVQVERHRPR